MKQSTFTFRMIGALVLLTAASLPASAQTIYRIVGADGKITFSDKPPVDANKMTATNAGGKVLAVAEPNALPFELRQIAARYPVTLYSATVCAPCNSGRLLLLARGIPFVENTVNTPEDNEALQRLSGDNGLPFLTIGGQKIKGFSEAEWSQFLNAANYPQTSALPSNYRNPAPKPLVAVQKPVAPKPEEENQARNDDKATENRALPAPVAVPAPSSPTGIRF